MNVVNREVAGHAPNSDLNCSLLIAAVVLGGLVVHGIVERHDNVTDLKTLADDDPSRRCRS